MEQIVAVERNISGDIISLKTSNGRVISYRKAIMEIQTGMIEGVQVEENIDQEGISLAIIDTFESLPTIYN
ncbi:DUF3892 domain-containing protein [Bacillus sp. B1-b2]|uniref:DUF3892 domain-containing protein n=1 Tax=Bacillus sp. B1-b2 TaxID=2653201 RepID=UPI0012617EAA|nr:DUF3892 domain-containing protein [Bacillus sp. B1-b2]KAB7672993.1 DUF3892 domain-containing protein [Bacillus sp. B1-b2]